MADLKIIHYFKSQFYNLQLRKRVEQGQVLVEYLLMTVMLLFLFTGLYRVLQGQLKTLFTKAGQAILRAYF